jgi:hypothetical protein
MPRKENKLGTEIIRIATNPQIKAYLELLVLTGFHGKTASEVAERLLAGEVKRLYDAKQIPQAPNEGTT